MHTRTHRDKSVQQCMLERGGESDHFHHLLSLGSKRQEDPPNSQPSFHCRPSSLPSLPVAFAVYGQTTGLEDGQSWEGEGRAEALGEAGGASRQDLQGPDAPQNRHPLLWKSGSITELGKGKLSSQSGPTPNSQGDVGKSLCFWGLSSLMH